MEKQIEDFRSLEMLGDDQPWMIVQEKVQILDRSVASIWCDRRQHLLILYYEASKNTSLCSSNSTISTYDQSDIHNGRSARMSDIQIVSKFQSSWMTISKWNLLIWVHLERIEYIQRSSVEGLGRSAWNSREFCLNNSNEFNDRSSRQLQIYYSTGHPRSEYLYKKAAFYLTSSGSFVQTIVDGTFH